MTKVWKRISTTILCVVCLASVALAQTAVDPLKKGFENPPSSARPRVWWHWMNGNITKEGIKLDLEWMHGVGIAGFQNFDAALATPQVVDKRLAYMTPEWKDAFKYAISLGDQFGMEMAIAGSPGWSESGGPWVPAPQGMKKYVWSETVVEGGKPFTRKDRSASKHYRAISEHRLEAIGLAKFDSQSNVLCRCCGRRFPRARSRVRGKCNAAEDHVQRPGTGRHHAERWRSDEDHEPADS